MSSASDQYRPTEEPAVTEMFCTYTVRYGGPSHTGYRAPGMWLGRLDYRFYLIKKHPHLVMAAILNSAVLNTRWA